MNETVIIPGLNITNTTLSNKNNSVEAQLGDVVNEEVESYSAQWVQHTGFCSLPPNAIPGKTSSECILLKSSNRDYVFASRDVASQGNYGNLNPGESCIYAAGPEGTAQARVMCKQDGSVNLYTTDTNDATGKGVYFQVSPTGFFMMAPWGKFVFDATGFHMSTSSGASFHLGGLNFPGPLAALGTYARLSAATTTIDSAGIMLGPPGLYLPATYSLIPPASPGQPSPPFTQAVSTSVLIGV